MKVLRADALGMCFGVRDALTEADRVARPGEVVIHGQLVHNEAVLADLKSRGFTVMGESDRTTKYAVSTVMITAHGISRAERRRLESSGKRLIDTTCPLVAKVHAAASSLADAGFHVLILGRRGHVEVRGIVEDLASCDVVQSVEDVKRYPFNRLGIVCQTTAAPCAVERIRKAIRRSNPTAEIQFADTICQPTRDRQEAVRRLAEQVDCMVVVGGRNSNNTRQLVVLCREKGLPVFHVQSPVDLRTEWFTEAKTVGLTAGTSTLDSAVEEVSRTLEAMNPSTLGCAPCRTAPEPLRGQIRIAYSTPKSS